MIPEQCAECLDEISQKSGKVLDNIEIRFENKLASFDDKSTIHFTEQSEKFDKFKQEVLSMFKWFMGGVAAIISICAIVVGITWLNVQSKIDAKDALTKNEAYQLTFLGDNYNRKIFVLKQGLISDTSAYYYNKLNIFSNYSIYRGSLDLTELNINN